MGHLVGDSVFDSETACGVSVVKVLVRSCNELMKMEVDHMKGLNIEDALVGFERDTNFGLEISNVFFGMWKRGNVDIEGVGPTVQWK